MRILLELDDAGPALEYFCACARIRDVSVSSLFRRLTDTIAADQLVQSILDDEGESRERRPGENRYVARPGDTQKPVP